MKRTIPFSLAILLTGPLLAADSGPKDDVLSASKKLADKANYSWRTTVVVPEGSRWRPGPTDGKTEKNGFTQVTMTFGENTTQAALKGDKAAITDREGVWQSVAELENSEGPGRWLAWMARNIKTPAAQATELVGHARDLKKDGESYSGELTEEGAKAWLTFRRGGAGGDGPTASNAKGTVEFWLKEGVLSKYEFKVQGKVSFNNNEMDVDRATTVEIKEVGSTKVSVPEAAQKKLS